MHYEKQSWIMQHMCKEMIKLHHLADHIFVLSTNAILWLIKTLNIHVKATFGDIFSNKTPLLQLFEEAKLK